MATTFFGSAATFRTPGNATLVQNLFSVQNNVGSPVAVKIRRIVCQLDATAALTAFMPLVKTTRPPALPTGGHALDKVAFDSTMTSNANVIVRGRNTDDGAAQADIVADLGPVMWQQYCMRLHTAVGQVLGIDNSLLPSLIETTPFVLRPGQSILVSVVSAVGTSNPTSNHWFVQCAWEEMTL